MTAYVALLYSITLGRERRLRNADWLQVLEGLGLERPRTFLATGNAVFETTRTSISKLETRLEDAFEQAFGKRIDTIVRTAAAFQRLMAANPFPEETERDPAHIAVRVMRRPIGEAAFADLAARASPREKVALVDGDLWIYTPEPPGTSRVVARLSRERSGIGTIRGWGTVRRLAAMLE
ncbi:MAG: DUF1697 domain-containing protein [Alphaproteobacteria bacterium]|nr:DUF1697 domain-containing protein [Alphaproteobacteria bacterium]MBU1516019.1 DUF1697 domain-containing protein [Alphaproteobacteria bacterium]MBU2092766.1 DUF1697 domain-containing protein [Alphaproteobacteria bacterium]MBU2153709.1 DUF1697 domain-containing protein [Alphaproteobacteria bacterium]MBU2308337.1 DUF1697 domain-containing protein [Alphaproteobacteria bacterium]